MTVTAPLDINEEHEGTGTGVTLHGDVTVHSEPVVDDVVIVDERTAPTAVTLPFRGDPVITFVYFGVLSLVAIIVASALLAL